MMENILTAYFHSMSNVVLVEEQFRPHILGQLFPFRVKGCAGLTTDRGMDQVALLGAGWEGEVGKWENKLGIRQQATATHIPESF